MTSYRRTLVGLKRQALLRPVGDVLGYRRTLVGLKPDDVQFPGQVAAGYRRTLVGLKRPVPPRRCPSRVLQTNPCGVEAYQRPVFGVRRACYRRTLVGLKRDLSQLDTRGPSSYRRTLVGLKRVEPPLERDLDDPLQTNPCGVEASWRFRVTGRPPVTDEPLWG